MRSRVAALGVAFGLLLVGPALAGSAGTVWAHAQLVSSSPGSGEALDTSPSELRLVFSEPLEAAYSSADLADQSGVNVLSRAGVPDSADGRVLVVPLPVLVDGSYTVTWRTLSTADGHTAEGFFTFAVGAGGVIGGHGHDGGGTQHGHGDDPVERLADVGARFASFGGLMFAFGLAVVALLLRRTTRRLPGVLPDVTWILLLGGAAGSATMLVLAAAALPGGIAEIGSYALDVRAGQLLVTRAIVAAVGAAVVFALSIFGRPRAALMTAALAGVAGLATISLGGHAAAFASPVPMLASIVHLGAAAIWASGVAMVAGLAVASMGAGDDLRPPVARYSAVALVAVALVGLSGTFLAWISIASLSELGSEYVFALALKLVAFGVALALGAVSYLDGGRDRLRPASFRARVAAETGLAVVVVLLAANLTIVSPPGPTRPVDLAATAGSRDPGAAAFALQPGRPGPNGFVVETPAPLAAGATVELLIQRLDEGSGEARIRLPAADASATRFLAAGGQLPPDSEWDATVVISDSPGGSELTRTRFAFALDEVGVASGRRLPAIDLGVLVAILLLGLSIVGVTFAFAGGRLPRTEAWGSRVALFGGGAAGAMLGAAILVRGMG